MVIGDVNVELGTESWTILVSVDIYFVYIWLGSCVRC